MKLNTESKEVKHQEKKVDFHDIYRQDFIGLIYGSKNDVIFEVSDKSMEEVIKKIENQLDLKANDFAYVKIIARLFKKKNNLILQENYHYFYKDEADNLLEKEIKKRKE